MPIFSTLKRIVKPKLFGDDGMFDGCLFKYRTLNEHTERILTHNEIYLTCPFDFNDPFDCQLSVSWKASEDFLREHIREFIEHLQQDPIRLPNKVTDEMVINEKIHLDTHQMREISRNAVESNLKNIGVFCLSAKCDDILMWSHYTDGHQGFCLAFEKDFYVKNPKKVSYKRKYPLIAFTENKRKEWPRKLLLTKSKRWKYEEEWRLLDRNPGKKTFDETKLFGIIFGCQMDDKDKSYILNLIDGRKHKPALFEAERKDNQYALKIVPFN